MNKGITGTAKKIDSRFDVLKFILALMIVALHTSLAPDILLPWLRLAVPLFFTMSSYFFFKKVNYITDKKETNNALRVFVKRSSILYLFWFVINLPATLIIRQYFTGGIIEGISRIVMNALFDSTFVASWFIAANVIGTCIIFLLRRYAVTAGIISLLLYLICCLTTSWYYAFPDFNQALAVAFPRFDFCFSFPAAMIWIWLGMMMAKRKVCGSLLLWFCMIIVGAIALYAEYNFTKMQSYMRSNDSLGSLLIICPAIFMYVRLLPSIYFPFSISLRRASIIIYFTHGSIARLLQMYYHQHHIYDWWRGPLSFAITLSLCTIVTIIILSASRDKHFKWLKYSY